MPTSATWAHRRLACIRHKFIDGLEFIYHPK
jgi:hypothetical protein